MDKAAPQINAPDDKKIDDYKQSLTSKRWPWFYVSRKKKGRKRLLSI